MLTLDAALQTAQDGLVRNPICRVFSGSFVEAIPFDGAYFNTSSVTEQHPALIETASGRLALVFSSGANLVYRYSDTDKIEFADRTIIAGLSGMVMYEAALVEISAGVLGVIFSDKYGTSVRLRALTISETGAVLTTPVTIESYAYADYQVREVCVINLTGGGFLAVYRKTDLDTTDQYLMQRTSADFATWAAEADTGV